MDKTETDFRDEIRRALASLTEREREVLGWRFGLTDGKFHTLKEVGEIYKVGGERIRQIEAKAFRKLECFSRGGRLMTTLSAPPHPKS